MYVHLSIHTPPQKVSVLWFLYLINTCILCFLYVDTVPYLMHAIDLSFVTQRVYVGDEALHPTNMNFSVLCLF